MSDHLIAREDVADWLAGSSFSELWKHSTDAAFSANEIKRSGLLVGEVPLGHVSGYLPQP
jgi:hypothetical protein